MEASESKSPDYLSLLLLGLLFVVLYLPLINGGLDDVRWVLFSALIGGFMLFRTGDLMNPAGQTLLWLLGANAGLRLFSVFWSPDQAYTLLRAISISCMCGFLVVLASRAHELRHFRASIKVVAGYGAALAVVSSIVYFAGWKALPWNGYEVYRGIHGGRFAGVFGNPNQIGICAAVTVPLMIGLWLEKKKHIWWLAFAALAFYMVLQSQSRAGILALAAASAGMLLVYQRQAKGLILGGMLLVVLFAMFADTSAIEKGFASFASRGETTEFNVEDVAENRLTRWTLGWLSIQKHFVLGQGYGIGGVSDGVDPRLTDYDQGYPLHNSFLQVWQENGVVGLLLFLALVGWLYGRILLSDFPMPKGSQHLIAGCTGVAMGGMVSAFFESWLFSVGNLGTMPFWACMALLWMRTNPAPAEEMLVARQPEIEPLQVAQPVYGRQILPYPSQHPDRS
ncbi:MAG: O-antigen ligase family protein [Verrucomicrobiota bacterium JB022]|nr:O-antigen ligase family protein [Verrucomicrobiota bacterium JB022]